MVEATDFANRDDPAEFRLLNWPTVGRILVERQVGCILVEREVGPRLMVIDEVAGQDAAEMPLAEHEYVIQALAPDRADEPLIRRRSSRPCSMCRRPCGW